MSCFRHPDCPMTAGYYFGGIWICWFHVLLSESLTRIVKQTKQKMQALPKENPWNQNSKRA